MSSSWACSLRPAELQWQQLSLEMCSMLGRQHPRHLKNNRMQCLLTILYSIYWTNTPYHCRTFIGKIGAVFNWESNELSNCRCFASLCYIICFKICAAFSSNQKQNRRQSWLTGTYFPMLCFSCMSALWILIGSRHCLCSLWLATSVCPDFSFNTSNWKLLYSVYPSHWSRALF